MVSMSLFRARLALPLLLLCLLGSALVSSPSHAVAGVVMVGAGDIADCRLPGDEATARLLDSIDGTVYTTGDNVYPAGTAAEYAGCYAPSWGRHRWRTRPSPGNHDYLTTGASGYFGYFGERAGPAGRGYYAYDRGTWRIYSLNSERLTDAQLSWLRADLASHPSHCSMAYWHQPLRSSGHHGNDYAMKAFWRPLYEAGVELIVNGHDHDYERFAPMRPDGLRYWKGIRQFVVGTGGANLRSFGTIKPNSQARQSSIHGVLKLFLADGEYSWRFISADGTYTDRGNTSCHGRP
jgi:acid phosphatase type 7